MKIPAEWPAADRGEVVKVPHPAPHEELLPDGERLHHWRAPAEVAEWVCAIGKDGGRGSGGAPPGEALDWTGNATLTDAVRMSVDGWAAGVKQLAPARVIADKAVAHLETETALRHDTSGSEVDVDAYLHGEPECMTDFAPAEVPTRKIRIVVDGYVSAGVEASEITARGRVIAASCLALQAVGICVELSIVTRIANDTTRSSRYGKIETHVCDIWRSGGSYDPGVLAAALMHAGWNRQLFFQAQFWSSGLWVPGMAHADLFSGYPAGPTDVRVTGLLLGNHPWTSPHASRLFMDACLTAAHAPGKEPTP